MKKSANTLKLQFDSLSQNESLARSLAAAFVMQLNPTVAELADIKCAVSEAVTNCTVHAYRDAVGPVYMAMHAYENRKIKFEQILEQSKEEIKVFAEEFLKNKPLPEMKPERIKEIIYGLFIEEKTLGEV